MKFNTLAHGALALALAVTGVAATGTANAGGLGAYAAPVVQTGATEAGLSWRCGKNNPAMWGTFGNGCLKQRRKAKKASKGHSPSLKAVKGQHRR
ncbi:MAG: hypothetical protein ROR55_26955 [Devosia sp.]